MVVEVDVEAEAEPDAASVSDVVVESDRVLPGCAGRGREAAEDRHRPRGLAHRGQRPYEGHGVRVTEQEHPRMIALDVHRLCEHIAVPIGPGLGGHFRELIDEEGTDAYTGHSREHERDARRVLDLDLAPDDALGAAGDDVRDSGHLPDQGGHRRSVQHVRARDEDEREVWSLPAQTRERPLCGFLGRRRGFRPYGKRRGKSRKNGLGGVWHGRTDRTGHPGTGALD